MNKLIIIGNLVKDPETRELHQDGSNATALCTFTVAVNSRNGDPEYFRVTAWRKLAETCARYLEKGRKVCVTGPVSVHVYKTQDGTPRATLEVEAQDVEFLSPRKGDAAEPAAPADDFPY